MYMVLLDINKNLLNSMSKKELESYRKEAIEKVKELLSKSLIKGDFDKVMKKLTELLRSIMILYR